MSEVVYLLGAGFNLSVLSGRWSGSEPPLSQNFFQVLIRSAGFRDKLEGIRRRIHVDQLLTEIRRYWGLTLDDLAEASFDIEECLTLLESLAADAVDADRRLQLRRASFALRNLLLMHLAELESVSSPAQQLFGQNVFSAQADVLTLNYDTVAERCVESASGVSAGPFPRSVHSAKSPDEVPDEDLDASHFNWKRPLGYGFHFDEVSIPVAGVPKFVPGSRYYSRPSNQLYSTTRVLKLHGSIDWLRYTGQSGFPVQDPSEEAEPPSGLVLERHPMYWMGEPARHANWLMDPRIIPPILYKKFDEHPFPTVWDAALGSLSQCTALYVVGYSFPPTDFRVRRLFLEAFSDHPLSSLTVVNPDGDVVSRARELTRFRGPVVMASDLPSLYGVPESWWPDNAAEEVGEPQHD